MRTTPAAAEPSADPMPQQRSDGTGRGIAWITAWVILGIYAAFAGWFLAHYKALPYFDQAQYVGRVYAIRDNLQEKSFLRPSTWLGGHSRLLAPASANPPATSTWLQYDYAMRGPLLIIPAAIFFGNHATPRELAFFWLAIRLAAIMAALWVMARRAGGAGWVPGALLLILGSAFWMNVEDSVYMMDHAFVAFGLLCFAAFVCELLHPSLTGALFVSLAVAALTLVKPAGPAFVLPMFAVLGVRAGVWIWRERGASRRYIAGWFGIYLGLGLFIAWLLLLSPYGKAVHAQYLLGSTGWYDWRKVISHEQWVAILWQMAGMTVPVWLFVPALAVFLLGKKRRGLGWVALAAFVAALWWYAFSTVLTYTADLRFPAAAFAVAASVCVMVLRSSRRLLLLATAVAAILFFINLGYATMASAAPVQPVWLDVVAGQRPRPARPVAEVGLLPAMARFRRAIRAVHPEPEPVWVYSATRNAYTEADTFCLAERYIEGNREPLIRYLTLPYGTSPAELIRILHQEWFITRSKAPVSEMIGDVWTLHLATHHLLVDPESPLRPLLERRTQAVVHFPFGEDTLTLWRLRRPPDAAEMTAILRYVLPIFKNTSGEKAAEAGRPHFTFGELSVGNPYPSRL